MIHVFILTVLVIYLPYVEARVGTPCTGHTDCDMTSEHCNLLGSCQCKAGYNNSGSFCYKGSSAYGLGGPCQNGSGCVTTYLVCNTTIGFGTCVCAPHNSYEYQGSCHEKRRPGETCDIPDNCLDINSVCSNSSGGICVCQTGYYKHRYDRCEKKRLYGQGCYSTDECIDEHAACNILACGCMVGYYAHQGSCIPRSALGGTCQNVDGCIGDHVVCDNATGVGICICSTGYYVHEGFCYKKAGQGGICQNHNGCTGESVVCSSVYNGTCVCNSSYIPYQENCYHMPDAPKNLLVLNVTSRAFTITLEQPYEVFGELLGYALKITLADTGRCVIENLIRCISGCAEPFPNQTVLLTTCTGIIQYQNVSKNDLVIMKHNVNILDPGTVYGVSVAAVSQYGKGYTADIHVTTLHEGDIEVGSSSESHSMDSIIIVSIVCGTLMVIALTVAGTVIIIKRKRASKSKSATDSGSTYVDLACITKENHYDIPQ